MSQAQCSNVSPITTNRSRPPMMSSTSSLNSTTKFSRSYSQSALPSSSSSGVTNDIRDKKTLTRYSSSTNNLLIQLTEDQRKVLTAIKKGKSLFFTGSGGTGKSFLINVIRKCLPNESCFVTASTGVAASLIDGVTLHSFSGVSADLLEKLYASDNGDQKADSSAENDTSSFDKVLKEILSKIVNSKEKFNNWKKCQHLVIDEISMVDSILFEALDFIARCVCYLNLNF